MIWPNDSHPMTPLDRADPLARGLVCAARMDHSGPAASNLVYPHLLTGAVAAGGLATPILAAHQDWYNRFGSGYAFCLWHNGIALDEAWATVFVIGDGTMAWQRYGSNTCLRAYHNGTGYTLPNVLLSHLADPGLLVGVWAPPQLRVYINGQQIDSVACYIAPKTTSSTSTLTLSGSTVVRQLLVYDRPLSVDEIQRLYRDPSSLFDRVRRWPPVIATGGIMHELAGSISTVSSLSGAARAMRALSSQSCKATSSLSASLSVRSSEPVSIPASQQRRPWRRAVLCNGACADGFKLSTALTRGWFWVRRRGCTAVYRGPTVDRVDFDRLAHVAEADAQKILLPAWLVPEAGSKCSFVVRRFNGHGDQEQTTGAAVVVRLGDEGTPAAPAPNDVFALHGMQVAGGRVRLEWLYCPLDQETAPIRFNVYADNGDGSIDFDVPLATITYQGRRFYRYVTDVLPDGTHRFVVRAEGADGVESDPGPAVSCPVRTTGPECVTILAAEAVL